MNKERYRKLFHSDPRSAVLEMLEYQPVIETIKMLEKCLSYMSHADIRDMLDKNEMSPRFSQEKEG